MNMSVLIGNTYSDRSQRLTDAIRHFVHALVLRREYIRSISWRSMSCHSVWKKLDTHHRGDQRELGRPVGLDSCPRLTHARLPPRPRSVSATQHFTLTKIESLYRCKLYIPKRK